VKRIASVLFVFSLVASPALASGVKAVAGTLGMGAVSSVLCVLNQIYDPEDEDASGEDFDRRGFFVGVSGGYAGDNFSDRPVNDIADIFQVQPEQLIAPIPGPDTTANADNSWTIKTGPGYRCHSRYSVGASFQHFGGFDTQWTGPLGTGGADIDIFAATVDIKGYLLTGRYQPYLLLGGGTMNVKTKVTNPTGISALTPIDPVPPAPPLNTPVFGPVIQSRNYTDFVFRFGGGVDLYATEHIVVNIDANYLAPVGKVSGVGMFTIGAGIGYRF
jgi:opacity protein-like surface antigen